MGVGQHILNSGGLLVDNQDLNAHFVSSDLPGGVLDLAEHTLAGIQLVSASGARAGTLTVELSIDGENWVATWFWDNSLTTAVPDAAASVAVTGSAALNQLVTIQHTGARYLRIRYVDGGAAGAGKLFAYGWRKEK